jgi:uncharacterized protein YecE (DUF72 family)
MPYIGTAGWSMPRSTPAGEGTHLHRYSRTLSCVEINSTFYRVHRSATFQKWAAETPANFRFSVKAPKAITHEASLRGVDQLLTEFLRQIEPLREKQGPILFQLPPSLSFDATLVVDFLDLLRKLYSGEVVLEPRHATWFSDAADELLRTHNIARVAANPPKGGSQAAHPGGSLNVIYYRLHGSPRIYFSNYGDESLLDLAANVAGCRNAWIIFDNTALSHAYANAIRLQEITLGSGDRHRR